MTMSVARKALLAGWLVLPLGAWAYHEGPGQALMRLDETTDVLDRAAAHVAAERWEAAVEAFDEAMKTLPGDRVAEARRIRIECAKAKMMCSGLPEAHADLSDVVDEMLGDPEADPAVLADARRTLATSQYYLTWLMRLEGQPREKWGPEIDAARQAFRLLAEEADADGDPIVAERGREDLESAVRLTRMDVEELQGLPLPSQ